MKLIIDIPEEAYEYVKTSSCLGWLTTVEYAYAIQNGTPLDYVKAEINSEIPKVRELFDIAYEYNKKDSTRTELSQKCTTYLLDIWQTMGAIVDNIGKAESEDKE